jgi:hypothetical protein
MRVYTCVYSSLRFGGIVGATVYLEPFSLPCNVSVKELTNVVLSPPTGREIFEFSLQPRSKINVFVEAQIWSMHVCFVDH